MADVSSVTTNQIKAQEGFSTTLNGSISSGATTVPLASTSGYTDGDIVALTIDRVDSSGTATPSKKQVFIGEVSGTNIINVKWTEGTNQSHSNGAVVEDLVSASHWAMKNKENAVEHNADGTHKTITTDTINESTTANGVTVDGLNIKDSKLNTNNSVVTANITDGAITNAKLSTTAGEIGGAWQTWTHNFSGFTGGSETVTARYMQIGKTVYFEIMAVLGATPSAVTNFTFDLPVNMKTVPSTAGHPLGSAIFRDSSSGTYIATVYDNGAGSAFIRRVAVSGSNILASTPSTTTPFTWASGDFIFARGVYEAA